MPSLQEVIQKGESRYTVTVPKTLVELKGWQKGDQLKFTEVDGKVCVENLSR